MTVCAKILTVVSIYDSDHQLLKQSQVLGVINGMQQSPWVSNTSGVTDKTTLVWLPEGETCMLGNLHFSVNHSHGHSPVTYCMKFGRRKTRVVGLLNGENHMIPFKF